MRVKTGRINSSLPPIYRGVPSKAKAGGSVADSCPQLKRKSWLSPLPPCLVALDSPPINRGAAKAKSKFFQKFCGFGRKCGVGIVPAQKW